MSLKRRRASWVGLLAGSSLFLAYLTGTQGAGPSSSKGRHVVVISVDGMRAGFYAPAPKDLPNIARLMREGSYASAVEGVYPTLTYPSHTTIVTGRTPAEHGIYTNLSSREPGRNPHDWFWFAKRIKGPTLWDEARRAQLSTASISWPVTAGAAIDWDVPEIWNPRKGEVVDLLYLAKYVNPLLSLEILRALGLPKGGDGDVPRVRLAAYLLKRHKPNLLLLHLAMLDTTEHKLGPDCPEARQALERMDTHIGELLEALRAAGLDGSTDVFVVSDHGFLTINREVAPNVLLVKAGLLTANQKGELTGGKIETVSNDGSFFIYWPRQQDLRAQVDAALQPLRQQGLVWAVIDRNGLKDLDADPDAQMALEAPSGTSFSEKGRGELVKNLARPAGTHGYLPFRAGLEASFIAWGPDIKSGVDLHRIRMTAVGPTILKVLGINDPQFGDAPPLEDILKK